MVVIAYGMMQSWKDLLKRQTRYAVYASLCCRVSESLLVTGCKDDGLIIDGEAHCMLSLFAAAASGLEGASSSLTSSLIYIPRGLPCFKDQQSTSCPNAKVQQLAVYRHKNYAVYYATASCMSIVQDLAVACRITADFTSFVPDNKVQHPQNQTFSNPNLSRFGFVSCNFIQITTYQT
jgi:hypothetical protein